MNRHRLTFLDAPIVIYRHLSRKILSVLGSVRLKIETRIGSRAATTSEVARATRKRSRQSLIFRATDPFGANWKTRAARERSSRPREDTGSRLVAFRLGRHLPYGKIDARCIGVITPCELDL